MRKIKLTFVMMLISFSMMAQENRTFEGEVMYESFMNTAHMKMDNVLEGVNVFHYIYKGDKLFTMEENSQSCSWIDYSAKTMTVYNALVGWGYSKSLDENDVVSNMFTNKDIVLTNPNIKTMTPEIKEMMTMKVTKYTFAPANEKKTIQGYPCHLFSGNIDRKMANMNMEYTAQAWVADQWNAPKCQQVALMGLEVDGMVVKHIIKSAGQINFKGGGETSLYIESELRSIEQREVKDEEVTVPSSYRIVSSQKDPSVIFKYSSELQKAFQENGIAERQRNAEPSFKQEGEWDF